MTKYWKCPHCAQTQETEDNIVMVLCPGCVDCNMDEIPQLKQDLIKEIEVKQLCLRCGKVPALKEGSDEGEYYCAKCIK
jgi:hypothetical protein